MKKILFLLAAMAVTTGALQAQYLGLKGGFNLSNLNISDVDNDARFGYHAGLFVNVPLGDALSVQPELLYSTMGSKVNYDLETILGSVSGESTLRLNYIQVPVLIALNIGDVAQINVGPYIGFLSTAEFEIDGDFEESGDLDNDNFRNTDFGLVGGLALNFGALQVGARYLYGLQSVEDSDVSELVLGDAANRSIQVYAAVRLGNYD